MPPVARPHAAGPAGHAPSRLRRHLVLGSLTAASIGAFEPARGRDAQALRIGQSAFLSGPLADLGQSMVHGASACFAAVNARGGIAGRPIELVTLDDGYDTARAVSNVARLMADRSLLALFNCMGTPAVEAVMPKVVESGIPFFAPFTGALSARPKDVRNVFNVRPSYVDEAARLIEHLATIGLRRIGIAYQNNSFGKEIWGGVRAALERHGLEAVAVTQIETDASNAAEAASTIVAARPEAVIAGVAGKPTLGFVKSLRAARRGLPIYALSIFAAGPTIGALGDDATGITVTQVVPYPQSTSTAIVGECRQDWQAHGMTLELDYPALEGYINARVLVEVLRRIGGEIGRAALIDSAWSLRNLDLGGFKIGFTEPGRSASRYIDITMVRKNGRFLR